MSGGNFSGYLSTLPDEISEALDERGAEFDPLVRHRLKNLIDRAEQLQKLVRAADRLLGGDIGAADFNFEWSSALSESDADA